jgi:uncharacterized protein
MIRTILKWLLRLVLLLVVIAAILLALNWDNFRRHFLGGVKVYETVPPTLPVDIKRPAILIFSKTNGYRHADSIAAANTLFSNVAKEEGWGIYNTENGATFSPKLLARFDAVIFNNVSGDVFTPAQREAFKAFVEKGGGFVGIHGTGGDPSYAWQWYVESLIGAQFIGHPMNPQFQQAAIKVENKAHPATVHLPDIWQRTDEWYSFKRPARKPGTTVLLVLDETSYSPKGLFGSDLAMGKDHAIAWWHCQGKGRVLYSALGHQPTAYAEPGYAAMLRGATKWALRLDGDGCEILPPVVKGTLKP